MNKKQMEAIKNILRGNASCMLDAMAEVGVSGYIKTERTLVASGFNLCIKCQEWQDGVNANRECPSCRGEST